VRPSDSTEGRNATAFPHTWLPERVRTRSGALLAAQVSLLTLPDALLGSILRCAWADRPPRPVWGEVSRAAGLACVCRRWRELLRAQPLPLALDLSAARLSVAQRRWLLDPAQAGRVEAASFHPEDALWEQPLLGQVLALHGGTLLQLSGVPLQLVARGSQGERPALDLSGLRLTKLGVNCHDTHNLLRTAPAPSVYRVLWLWPECLPGALEELQLLGVHDGWLGHLAWAPHWGSGLAGRLPRLQTLRIKGSSIYDDKHAGLVSFSHVPLLTGFANLPQLEVDGSWVDMNIAGNLASRVRSLRVMAGPCMRLWDDLQDVAAFVDRLCHAGLQAAELSGARCIELCGASRSDLGPSGPLVYEVVREMISRCGDRFAVEADPGEGPEGEARLRRLAWRRWPAADAPDMPAAMAAHERARAWAAAVGWPEDSEHIGR
jgi:hypothetical protein